LAALLGGKAADEAALGRATAQFLDQALLIGADRPPAWVADARARLRERGGRAGQLASELGLHPAYLARAYRAATGEGVGETQRRRRVERASALLRHTTLPIAEIAVAGGFCDQSHMNRCFAAVLGRTPLQVRRERRLFDEQRAASA